MQEERWACWSCQIPVDPNYPHRTGKVTFSTAKEQCFHWWLNYASPSQWHFFYERETFGVTHDEIMLAVGIDLKTCPLPIGTALERIPKILPSHEAGHDPLLRGEPWFRKVASPTIPSERNVPWAGNTWRHAPQPPAGPPPDHVKNASFFERAILWVMVMQRVLVRVPMAKRPPRTILRRLISSRSMRRRQRRT